MGSLDERVAYLEGRMEDNNRMFAEIRAAMTDLRVELRAGVTDLRGELRTGITDLRADLREFRSEVSSQFVEVNARFSAQDARFNAQDEKIDRHFMWMLGAEFAVLLSVIGALTAAYFRAG